MEPVEGLGLAEGSVDVMIILVGVVPVVVVLGLGAWGLVFLVTIVKGPGLSWF